MEVVEKRKKKDIGKTVFLCTILSVPISNFLVFWLYVNFDSILMAFQYNKGLEVHWGFYNFTRLWADMTSSNSTFWMSMKNTMIFFLSNLLITLPVSLLLCYFFFKKIWGYKAYRFIFYIPSLVSASIYVVLFSYLIRTSGPLGMIIEAFGGTPKALLASSDTALNTILVYTILSSFGGNIILFGGAMNHIDGSILEAAKIDGCKMGTEIFKIVIPLIWPTLSTLITFAFVGMFSSSGAIMLFLESGAEGVKASTLSYWIYAQVYYSGEYYYPATIGLILTVIGLPIALGVKKLLGNTMEAVEM
ncbi:MAG: sugar ABC transporter permease [Clostridia bacterium]|nr:sugar ABC transporter permease [Clostridia bacterium]